MRDRLFRPDAFPLALNEKFEINLYPCRPINQIKEKKVIRNSLILACIIFLLLPGCTWVKPTALGEDVTVAQPTAVAECKKIGTTTSYVKDSLGPLDRSEEKVRKELTILAQNRAAEMGGDTIVAEGEVDNGSLRFQVYDCR